jgi:hypothetical protein
LTGGGEHLEEFRGQTIIERPAAIRIDMNPVTLQPIRSGPISFVNRCADSCLLQTLRQAEPANTTAYD